MPRPALTMMTAMSYSPVKMALPEDLTAQMKTILDAATAQLTSITTAVSDGAFADKISSLENQMTETQMALCDVYEQVIAATSATEG